MPYELLTGDLSQVSFASSRVGIIEFRRLVTTLQWLTVIPMARQPIWRWFCKAAYLAGAVRSRRLGLSNGIQEVPPIGVQKGPLAEAVLRRPRSPREQSGGEAAVGAAPCRAEHRRWR